jgi:hypothetical protein
MDCRTLRRNVSKNHTITAAKVRRKLDIHLGSCFHKTVRSKLHKSTIHGMAAIIIRLITGIILYFSILLHCIVQWVLQVMSPSAFSFIVYWFSTVLRYRQTHKQENTKKTRRKTAQEQNTNEKHAECDPITKKQRSRILKHMKINTEYLFFCPSL